MSYGGVRRMQSRMFDAIAQTEHYLRTDCGFTRELASASTLTMQFDALALTRPLLDELKEYVDEIKRA